MFKWTPFPFLRFSLALASGILIAHHFPALWDQSFATVYLLIFLFVLIRSLRGRSLFEQPAAAGVLGLLLLAYLGGVIYRLDEDRRWSSHYTKQSNVTAFQGQVLEEPKETTRGWRFIAEVQQVVSHDSLVQTTGKAVVFLRKGEVLPPSQNDIFYAQGVPASFRPPGNPGQFDYGRYMARQHVYGQAFVEGQEFAVIGRDSTLSISSVSSRLRNAVLEDLSSYFINDEVTQIASALLLGIKEDLSDDLRSAYATAGATHVLAVSGLHVGIVFLLLGRLLRRLKELPLGKPLFVIIVVLCIWLYAIMTGMSPSVFRAATMFTILTLGEASGNNRNIFNTLGVAAFVLLLYRPGYLFDLGFQFSYLAVLGIVYLFPRLNSLILVTHPILSEAWKVTCVSVAAQIAVAPLSIYYFHQFPTYFLFTNLIVALFAFLILLLGLPMIVLGSVISWLAYVLAGPLEILILVLNAIIRGVERLPGSAVTGVSVSLYAVLLTYAVLLCVFWALEYKRFLPFALGCCLLIGIAFHSFKADFNKLQRVALVIYDVRNAWAMDLHAYGNAKLIGEALDRDMVIRNVDPARLLWGYEPASLGWQRAEEVWRCDSVVCVGEWEGIRMLRIYDDISEWEVAGPIETNLLVISNNARIKSDQWADLRFDHLVFDGTNDYWYVQEQQEVLTDRGVSPHFVRRDGFWQLALY
ncbi:MAG: ComEC/Rec2 family competence protein [Bacteroidota bacterium]